MAGLWTELCVLFPALSALKAGYEVTAVVDASAGENPQTQDAALRRLVQAGVGTTTWFSLATEYMRSWANAEKAPGLMEIAGEHQVPFNLVDQYFQQALGVSQPISAS